MAPSLSGAKFLSALVMDGFSAGLRRRGYATVVQGVASNVVKGSAAAARSGSFVKKTGDEKVVPPRKSPGFRILSLATTARRIAPTR